MAARTADLARSGHPVTPAAVVRSTGFSTNALLHQARHRRIQAEADAILAAVLPAIARAGPVHPAGRARPGRPRRPGRPAPWRALPLAAHSACPTLVVRNAGGPAGPVCLSPSGSPAPTFTTAGP
ncbi:hypothetical protein [Streptomyces prasinus]|uniref:hypothetical protein n=1 Tax=Streptomyces prasinus TaxID=67345 RepID=UPI0012FEA0D6|nr:hypothetical protein [Streptomyces prasinus]